MNSDRLKILQGFVEEDPTDPFNYFALGLELAQSNPEEAEKHFDHLLSEFPDYLPTYYHAALLKISLSRNDQAAKIIIQGIEIAKRQNNQKTANELAFLLDDLLD